VYLKKNFVRHNQKVLANSNKLRSELEYWERNTTSSFKGKTLPPKLVKPAPARHIQPDDAGEILMNSPLIIARP